MALRFIDMIFPYVRALTCSGSEFKHPPLASADLSIPADVDRVLTEVTLNESEHREEEMASRTTMIYRERNEGCARRRNVCNDLCRAIASVEYQAVGRPPEAWVVKSVSIELSCAHKLSGSVSIKAPSWSPLGELPVTSPLKRQRRPSRLANTGP